MNEDKDHAKFLSSVTSKFLQEGKAHFNLGPDIIVITEDRLKGILRDYVDCLAAKKEWHTPASIFVTIALVLITTEFKDSFGVPKYTWQAVFIVCAGLSALWLVRTAWNALWAHRTLDSLMTEIKKSNIPSSVSE